jgi:hypothetical protein
LRSTPFLWPPNFLLKRGNAGMSKKMLRKVPRQDLHSGLLPVPKIILREDLVDRVKKKGLALIPPIDLLRGKEGHLPKGRDLQRGRV